MNAIPFCRVARGYAAYEIGVPAANALEVGDPEGLRFLAREDINLLVWRRGRQAPRLDALLAVSRDARAPDEGDPRLLRAATLVEDISAFVQAHYPVANAATMAFAVDLFELAALLIQLTGAPALRPRIERVEHDGCRLFHADRVPVRLLCTYCGPGTQWVPDAAANRAALGKGDNAAICPDPGSVRSIARGDVALLKGDLWPGNAGRGLIHRSPPLGRSGTQRLLLALDIAAG